MTTTPPVHIGVVLDRSGSMGHIADDVVGGFNEYLRLQRQRDGEARISLVQFDSEDPFEVLVDGVDLRKVADLDRAAYQPRGTTPLLDAVGRMIGRVDADVTDRAKAGLPEEDQIVVIVTDGLENASREFTRSAIFEMVEERRGRGWVFVFLGADQDAYAEGTRMGMAGPNTAVWEKSKAGTRKVWDDLEYSTTRRRAMSKPDRDAARDVFYEERDAK